MDDLSVQIVCLLVVSGFFAAFIDSVVGGGGLISVPVLMVTGLPPSLALGTNKLASTMGSLTSTLSFIRSGKVNFRVVGKLFPLSVIGAIFGAFILKYVSNEVLKPIVVFLLFAVAIFTLMKKDWGAISTYKTMSLKKGLLFSGIVMMIGFYDGFLGPGTGSFLLFAFILMGFDFLESAGNTKVLNFASNASALITFMIIGNIHYSYGLIMGLSMVVGAWVGSNLAIRKGTKYVRVLFIVVTFTLIGKMGFDLLHAL